MRLATAGVLLCLALAACGEDDEPGGRPTPESGDPPHTVVAILSESAVGGTGVGDVLQALDSPGKTDAFASQFGDRLEQRILARANGAQVPDGQTLAGAVAHVGCGAPTTVSVEARGLDWVVVPGPTGDENIECIAAVTTVALVTVPIEG